uniref:Uncharacterized protein n=1 Tax=Anguilla anguilla TaxID=7936 RepID=A0A0E9QJS8_ANGAN
MISLLLLKQILEGIMLMQGHIKILVCLRYYTDPGIPKYFKALVAEDLQLNEMLNTLFNSHWYINSYIKHQTQR